MTTGDSNSTGKERSSASGSSAVSKAFSGWKAHLFTFAITILVVWVVGTFSYIYFSPRLAYSRVQNAIVQHGLGGSGSQGIPINTLYTQATLASPTSSNSLESTENRDTLYTVGVLDLSKGPVVLHVPDMAGRYYVVQFIDSWGTVFAYVGRRTTGTTAGNFLISGPGWKGTVPSGMKQIVATENTVALIGRTLVYSDSDVATAYGLARQIQVTPLSQWHPGQ